MTFFANHRLAQRLAPDRFRHALALCHRQSHPPAV